jgi:lipid-A-disaccharide synthase
MRRPPRVLIVAGEASGDELGAGLVRAYREAGGRASFVGMGGAAMRAAGVETLVDAAGLAVVGAAEVLAHLPAIWRAYRALAARLAEVDAVVLIDYQEFNRLMARAARRRGRKVLFYVAPQVWAWRPGRVRTVRRAVDHLAVVLPFERALFEAAGVPVTYVGHPLVDGPRPPADRRAAREALGLDPSRETVALLPGSRRFEVGSLLPVLLGAAARLAGDRAAAGRRPLQFVLPLASTVPRALVEGALAAAPVAVRVVDSGRDDRGVGAAARALAAADVALTASGTATLETALAGTPLVIVYKVRPLTYLLVRLLIRVRMIGLVNLIAGRPVAPELIQGDATPEAIAREAAALLDDPARRAAAEAGLAEVRAKLGPPGASRRVAGVLARMLGEAAGAPASAAEPGAPGGLRRPAAPVARP